MAPVNSSVPTRTPSTRIRQATSIQTASNGQQGRTSSSNSNSNSNNSPSTSSNTARNDTTDRSRDARGPGRPRKEPVESAPVEGNKPTKPRGRGRPPKTRDPSTDSSDASSDENDDEDASPQDSPRTKQTDLARRTNNLEFAKGEKLTAQGSPSSSSSRIERNGSNITKEDEKSTSRDSSDEDEDDSDRDDKGPKEAKEGAPPKRRLRSSRVFEHSNDDQDGDDTTYTPDQQRLKEKVSAAEALSRVLRDNIHDPDSFHPDSVDAEDYELIQNTFGDIEDLNLNLNLTGHMSATDDSSGEDDQLTRELKRRHRQAKSQLTDTTNEFVDARRRLLLKKSADLDTEEAQIRAGTHPSLLSELNAIEERRKSKLGVVAARKSYHRESINSTFKATLKAAHDQYTEGQVTARKTMVDLVQNRINRIKQEIIQDSRTKAFFAQRSLAASLKRREALWEDDDECHDSCSSYDSYSSSGSECSDCEVCELSYNPSKPPYPRGLSRREAEADIAYLYQDRDSPSVTKQNQGLLRSQALMAVVDKEQQRIAMADKEKERLDNERERLEMERERIEKEGEWLDKRKREPSDRPEQDKVERRNPSERHEDKDTDKERVKEKEKDKEKDRDNMEREDPIDRYNEEWRQVMENRNRAPQQYFIDHLNEEKRRKRRVEDRELQTKSAHQKLMDSSKAPVRPKDEPMDLDQDVALEEGSSHVSLHSPELESRPYKSLGNVDTDRMPRFVPGFGPEGLEARNQREVLNSTQGKSSPSSSSSTPQLLSDVARPRLEAIRPPTRPTSSPATPRDPSWPLARRADAQGPLVSKGSTL
ncbi:hypothetical protein BGZ81_002593 [Podila clonocystis]|nr:hypothetical protein BGZ81_002593 [Podila clonocystis]